VHCSRNRDRTTLFENPSTRVELNGDYRREVSYMLSVKETAFYVLTCFCAGVKEEASPGVWQLPGRESTPTRVERHQTRKRRAQK